MPTKDPTPAPEHTAVRVALWRALHVEQDAPPHVLDDVIGLAICAPPDDWRARRDMDAGFTRRTRASIVTRTRVVEDLVEEQAARGVAQYVILGAGVDTFAQRRPELASRLRVFEVDQPGPQAWKQERLRALGYARPDWLRFVPVDFEAGASWRDELARAGFDAAKPAVFAATGVSMYLTREAIVAMLRQLARLAPGSSFAMTFMLPVELVEPSEKPMAEIGARGAAAAGTPFLSYFSPDEIVALARECGFASVRYVSAADTTARYFAGRADGLTPSNGEEIIIATT